MMAWRVHEFGPPNVMRFERVLRPTPGPSEVLVQVEAAGVCPSSQWGQEFLACVWEIRLMVLPLMFVVQQNLEIATNFVLRSKPTIN